MYLSVQVFIDILFKLSKNNLNTPLHFLNTWHSLQKEIHQNNNYNMSKNNKLIVYNRLSMAVSCYQIVLFTWFYQHLTTAFNHFNFFCVKTYNNLPVSFLSWCQFKLIGKCSMASDITEIKRTMIQLRVFSCKFVSVSRFLFILEKLCFLWKSLLTRINKS